MAKHPSLNLQVAYCTLRGAEASHDPEFGANIQWDLPLLDGYAWTHIPNRGSGVESFFGLFNPGLWKLIRRENYDAVLCFIGYPRATFWIACLASKFSKAAFISGTDATSLAPRDGKNWKTALKKILWPCLFRLADQVVVPSSSSRDLLHSLGIPLDRLTLTPYSVDNEWWMQQSSLVRRTALRDAWGAAPDTTVVLFCAKLQPWKRPADLLRAFARADVSDVLLVFAGEGSLRQQLEAEAAALGIASRVRFLGFVNQSQLPAVYTSADLMVLPSEYEPFAVVVNEAMCCGCPVSLQRVRFCKLDVEGAELAILKSLSHADLARIQSFALEYHEEAYDLHSLLLLVLDWRTHHVSFIEERPYIGNIMRLAASSALLTS